MGRYLIRRLLQAIPLLWLITVLVFALIHLIPGGPLAVLINPKMTKAAQEAIKAQFGLNDPVYIQYFKWLGHVLTGDFGFSFGSFLPVSQVLQQHFPPTIELFSCAFFLAMILAIILGTFSGIRQGTWLDYLLTTLSYFGIAMPIFLFGLLAQDIFAVQLQLLPVSDMSTAGMTYDAFNAVLDHLI